MAGDSHAPQAQPIDMTAPAAGTVLWTRRESRVFEGQALFQILTDKDDVDPHLLSPVFRVRAPADGWVRPVAVEGERVQEGTPVVVFEGTSNPTNTQAPRPSFGNVRVDTRRVSPPPHLWACPACGHSVSTNRIVCEQCGYDRRDTKPGARYLSDVAAYLSDVAAYVFMAPSALLVLLWGHSIDRACLEVTRKRPIAARLGLVAIQLVRLGSAWLAWRLGGWFGLPVALSFGWPIGRTVLQWARVERLGRLSNHAHRAWV